mmetsp:Transcript_24539/g.57754  ORF Transcript_24539/g.57754 Transcript_24539/m.57754 type:complete len:262 (-) Transcript_24539:30-815(-)
MSLRGIACIVTVLPSEEIGVAVRPVCKELVQSGSKWGSPTAVNRPICHLRFKGRTEGVVCPNRHSAIRHQSHGLVSVHVTAVELLQIHGMLAILVDGHTRLERPVPEQVFQRVGMSRLKVSSRGLLYATHQHQNLQVFRRLQVHPYVQLGRIPAGAGRDHGCQGAVEVHLVADFRGEAQEDHSVIHVHVRFNEVHRIHLHAHAAWLRRVLVVLNAVNLDLPLRQTEASPLRDPERQLHAAVYHSQKCRVAEHHARCVCAGR